MSLLAILTAGGGLMLGAAKGQSYAGRIAQVIDSLNDALLNSALAAHPELAGRIEAELEEFGRIR